MKFTAWFKSLFDIKLLKFLLVGVINTIVGSGLMFLLYNCFNVPYWPSSACNYVAGGICSYFLNKYFTFKNHSKSKREVVYFILTILVCYFISYVSAKKLIYIIFEEYSEKFKGNLSLILGMCLYTGLNYLGQRFIVFKERKHKNTEENQTENQNEIKKEINTNE